MEFTLLLKIAAAFFAIGVIGFIINFQVKPPSNEFKYHAYSTVPMWLGVVLLAINFLI